MKLNNEARVGLMITASFTIFIILVALLAKINISRQGIPCGSISASSMTCGSARR